MISRKLSSSISVASIICTFLVVCIHYNTKKHILTVDYLANTNYIIQEFMTNGVARVAVPFFALVSGFFLFSKLTNISSYKILITKRFYSLFLPYIISSSLILSFEFVYRFIYKGDPIPDSSYFYIDALILKPLTIQHWFLRDLIILCIASPIIRYIHMKFGFLYITAISLLWLFDLEFMPIVSGRYLISIETLAFFSMGLFLIQIENRYGIENLIIRASKFTTLLTALFITLLAVRIYIFPNFSNYYNDIYSYESLVIQNSSIALGIILVFMFSYRIENRIIYKCSDYAFFIFLFHLLPLSRIINKLSDLMISDQYKFYFNAPVAMLASLALGIILSNQFPKAFSLVTGGRGKREGPTVKR